MKCSDSGGSSPPLVSVIIPTFNRANLLQKCLESLIAQTFSNFEVLIFDDGSSDGTTSVILAFEHRLRIRHWRFSNSGRPAVGRNFLIQQSKSPYLAILDSDDLWSRNKLLKSLHALENGAEFVYHDLRLIHGEGQETLRKVKSRRLGRNPHEFLRTRGNVIPASSVVVRRELVIAAGCFDESSELTVGEDYDLWLKISKRGAKFRRLRGCHGAYRTHEGNISSSGTSDETLLRFRDFYSSQDVRTPNWVTLGLAYHFRRIGDIRQASHYFLRATLSKQPHRFRRDRLRAILGLAKCGGSALWSGFR